MLVPVTSVFGKVQVTVTVKLELELELDPTLLLLGVEPPVPTLNVIRGLEVVGAALISEITKPDTGEFVPPVPLAPPQSSPVPPF